MFHLKRQLNLAKRFLIVFSNISGLATQETFSNKITKTRLSRGLCIFFLSSVHKVVHQKVHKVVVHKVVNQAFALYSHAEHGAFGVVVE